LLTSNGFTEGTTAIVEAEGAMIGDIFKIKFRTAGTDSYECTTIRVMVGATFWDFDCIDAIHCPQRCFVYLYLGGAQTFEITTWTNS